MKTICFCVGSALLLVGAACMSELAPPGESTAASGAKTSSVVRPVGTTAPVGTASVVTATLMANRAITSNTGPSAVTGP